ncbi:MAG: hypothetical protein H8E44_46175 [Planctomycetes bacterium]|nr:hypothetical protein [Planctomycetota bacterium]MBL7042218.1 hypothetical protein [Pirellulaceae bacterium]
MLHRRFLLSLIALASLLLPGFGMRADADLGLESKCPLSDPHQAKIDERIVGTWRAIIQEKTYYLHVGTGNVVGQSNWMELVLVNPGDKPTFYLHHKIGFPSTVDDESFFSIANLSVLISQLRGSETKDLMSAVGRWDIFKYDVTEDYLDVWAPDQNVVREAIKAGKIKGTEASTDDTTENLIRFLESSAEKVFVKKVRYTRVK